MSKKPPKVDDQVFRALVRNKAVMNQIVSNAVINSISATRATLAGLMGDGKTRNQKDLEGICGYPTNPGLQDFLELYRRDGIAEKVVHAFADRTWAESPRIYENKDNITTDFEQAWQDLQEQHNLWFTLNLADAMSGLGRFGIIFLGVDDGKAYSQPITPKPGMKLLFCRVFSEVEAEVASRVQNVNDPRNGQVEYYNIQFDATEDGVVGAENSDISHQKTLVHWSRCIHLFDNRRTSIIFGTERMRPVFRRLLDLEKTAAGSAEMYWRGAYPGFSIETHPSINEEIEVNTEDIKDEVEKYQIGLSRYMALENMTVKSLAPQISDPTPQVMVAIRLIATSIGMPMKIFLGAEAGHMASQEDKIDFNKTLKRRQEIYVDPMIVGPLINRLTDIGVLPKPKKWFSEWPDLNSQSDTDKADYATKITQALLQYVTSGAEKIMPVKTFLTEILRLTEMQASAIVKEIAKASKLITKEIWQDQTGQQPGKPKDPAKKTGSSGKRNNQSPK